jgi:glycosyltransferase involved in cell wall biosynthesis/putative methionine-R-sulfoxide reductase with GAF domain
MRVLMLVSEAPPIRSGIARVAGKLTDGLRERGITVDVLSANEIPRATWKEFRFSSLAAHWPGIQRRLGDYDILNIHGIVPTFSDAALLMARLGRRHNPSLGIVYTHHSDIDIAGLEAPTGIYNAVHHRMLRLADHVVASTPSYAMRLESTKARPGRVSAVGFGVEAVRFQSPAPKPERFNVLFVGQLRPYKGVDVLLNAWRHVKNADLHIVGDGHEGASLRAMAADLGLDSVHFHGAVTDAQLTDFYANAHVLALPSTRKAEAFGLVLLEAMAAGCVPIASNLPGVSDVVGTSGYTFPVGDSDALAALLVRLRDDPAGRQALGARAAGHAIACAWDYTAGAYEGIFQQVSLVRRLEVAAGRRLTPAALNDWLRDVAQVTQADRASVMLLEPGRRELHIAASIGVDPLVAAETRLPIGQRMAGFAAHSGRSMLVSRRNVPALARLYRSNPELTSSLIVPVTGATGPVGVFNLARGEGRMAFTEADQRWLQRLALQVEPLLASARLPVERAVAAPALGSARVKPAPAESLGFFWAGQ